MAKPPFVVAFDTETTGVDVENDRIVTAFVGLFNTELGVFAESWDWLIDPGVEIPEGAARVHGISTEHARLWGDEPAESIYALNQRLDIFQRQGLPFVVMNARYDFTLLDRETRRWWPGLRPFHPALVLDPLVLDKQLDPFRKGKRNLVALCQHLGVPVEHNAHDAAADCLMAARAAIYLLTHRSLAGMSLEQVHAAQVGWAAQQARGLAAYFRKTGKSTAGIAEAWPLIPHESESK
jgi:DNA polymerase-3 subunit epsilon